MKRVYLYIYLIISILDAQAQQLPIDNQYMVNKFAWSPAFAGMNENIEAFVGYRHNWVGIQGAPVSKMFNINGPLTKGSGFGLAIVSENTGNFNHFHADLSFAYHVELSNYSSISFALSGKVYRNQIDLTRVETAVLDPVLENSEVLTGTTFNAAAGVVYNWDNLYVGVAMPRILGTAIQYGDGEGQTFTTAMQFLGHASYTYAFNRRMEIEPLAIVRMTANNQLLYEGSLLFKVDKSVWFGAGYRKGNVISIAAGAAVTNIAVINYSYEFGMGSNTIAGLSSGTHEITIGFLIKAPRRASRHQSSFTQGRKRKTIRRKNPSKQGNANNQQTGVNPVVMKKLEKKVNALLDSLKTVTANSDAKIKELDDRIKKLEGNIDANDADAAYEAPFIFKNIRFASASDRLFSSSFAELDKLANKMLDDPDLEIKITGHTDNVGSPRYNKRLSQKRAQAIANYLISKSVSRGRIETDGLGMEKPIASNDTKVGRAKNRRIEGRFKKKK